MDSSNLKTLTDIEIEILTQSFSLSELKDDVLDMASNKAARPDGFNIEFYQHNWEVVKEDMFGLLKDLKNGNLDIARPNYGVASLIPKGKDADKSKNIDLYVF